VYIRNSLDDAVVREAYLEKCKDALSLDALRPNFVPIGEKRGGKRYIH
jgi:hypothetical protein